MALEITVGPPRLAINQGYGALITDQDGQIRWPTDKGFYHADTRVISSWRIYADGEPWILLNSGNIAYYANRIFLTNPAIHTEIGEVPEHTLALSISRSIGGGIHEDLDLVNHGRNKVQFNLEIAVRSDFADIFEVKSGDIVRRGRITTAWSQHAARLTIVYINKDFERRIAVTAHKWDSKPVYANGRISFQLELKPGEMWHSCLLYAVGDGETIDHAPDHCIVQTGGRMRIASSPNGGMLRSSSRRAMRSSTASTTNRLRIWLPCDSPSRAPTIWSSCLRPESHGSWRCSAATAS